MTWNCEVCDDCFNTEARVFNAGIQLKRAILALDEYIQYALESLPVVCSCCLSFICGDCVLESVAIQRMRHLYVKCPLCDNTTTTASIYELPDEVSSSMAIQTVIDDILHMPGIRSNALKQRLDYDARLRLRLIGKCIPREPLNIQRFFHNANRLMAGDSISAMVLK